MKRFFSSVLLLVACLASASGGNALETGANAHAKFQRRYILVFANMSRAADREKLLNIAKRASAAGYNGIMLGSRAGEYIDLWNHPPREGYAETLAEIRQEMDALHLALIPYALSPNEVGYAAPELSEAIPCKETPFRIHGKIAEMDTAPEPLLKNPGFEEHDGNSPQAWGHDKAGVITFIDNQVTHGGHASVRIQDTAGGDPKNGHGRLWQDVQVAPFRAYEFSIWLKTKDLPEAHSMQFYFEGTDGGQPMVYANRENGFGAPIKATQDWTKYTIHFNSASNRKLSLYLGIWSTQSHGTLWLDDADLHEVGLFHTVRRNSLPITVTSADGAQVYEEGRDYAVKEQRLEISNSSRISDGAPLHVTWYQRAEMIGPPFANASHEKYFEVERSIAQKLDNLFGRPPGFMMTFDEWRIANWDPASGQISAGEYMAQTVRKTTEMLRQINPHYELFVWSDMFDPNENALKKYFMCNGPLTDSWKGLSKDTTVVTWDGGAKALKFFSDLGLRQMIGGYYSSMPNVKEWLDHLAEVEAQGATGIDGFMYTTWDDNFTDIEKVAETLRQTGRWPDATK